jgi:mono/diheme cytochrome c family protein
MKKLFVLLLLTAPFVLQFCSSSKKTAKAQPLVTYNNDVQSLILANCSPCHIPAKGGRVKALDTYGAATANIDATIDRIQRNPDQKGFMPFKHPKLSDSTINVFVQWKKDGLRE